MTRKLFMRLILSSICMIGIAMAMLFVAPDSVRAKDTPGTQAHRGLITSRPAGQTGTWVVGGRTFVADSNTEFDTAEGPLNVGACAKVRYFLSGTADVADEIDSEPASDCGGSATPSPSPSVSPSVSPSPSASPSATAQPSTQIHRGILNSRPSGKVGIWVIGGRAFSANTDTELDEVEGALVVGACAKVRYFASNGADVADELDSEPPQDCGLSGTPTPTPSVTPSPTTTPTQQIQRGFITSRPTGLLGTWVVAGRSFVANNDTEFDTVEGPLNVGACVKVRYFSSNGVDVADEIDSEPASDCNSGSPTPTPSATPRDSREDSKVYATLDAFPAAPYMGVWKIGGADYQANSATEFEQKDGAFAVGACVKAEFVPMNGISTLEEVETEEAYKCQQSQSDTTKLSSSYGVVDSFTTTVPSIWVVSGISYTVNVSTVLNPERGPFAVGAFVEVKYSTANGARTATRIETHIAPGTGNNNSTGRLNTRPSDDWGIWVINGLSYQGDRAILVELPASFGVALQPEAAPALVQLNSYTQNGVNYATLIRGLGNNVFMPMVTR